MEKFYTFHTPLGEEKKVPYSVWKKLMGAKKALERSATRQLETRPPTARATKKAKRPKKKQTSFPF